MKEHILQINDVIQVRTLDAQPRAYSSRVEDVLGEDLVISWPTEKGARALVRENQAFLITFERQRLIYGFEVVVRNLTLKPTALIAVQAVGSPQLIERRDDVRVCEQVPVLLGAKVVSITRSKDSDADSSCIQTHTQTVSAGGFTVHHQSIIPVGAVFDVRMTLPDRSKPLDLTARVVRCDPIRGTEGQNRFEIGLVYTQIAEGTRAQLVRFVFKVQAKELRSSADD
jgi:c-di-GMP-binding flagellar brake protein YcgR